MAAKPPNEDSDDEGDKGSFKITEQVLLDFADKFETLLKDLGEDPAVASLTQWAQGNSIGDDGKILPGNTGQLQSAKEVQEGFKAMCAQVVSGLNVFRGVADSGFLTLKTIKLILDNTADDAVSVTEMWEILNSIQQGAKTQSPGPSAPTK
ncbi:hypothetical protein OG765_29700 [Streptomyces sp. NBC_00555]|uniref:hypothetical protein n=1 Tax=Streptomyces sp. NBC_00555 TaxID=2903662 RepID=UPI00224F9B90|nr:hypothetical protein [Streptomyces sp. NBC_00555]MCX5015105.1 hypothetical protein [Streptomyces sp. NBC_00555]